MPDKIIVACSSCAAQYNVATLQPGARFKCQKCGTINTVPMPQAPDQPAAKPPTRIMPRAPAGRPAGSPSGRPVTGTKPPTRIMTPAKGMGIKTSGLKKGLPGRRPAEDFGEDDLGELTVKKKSKAPLFIGIGIGVVILVVIIIALSSGGGGIPDEEAAMLKKVEEEVMEKEKAEAEAAKKAEEDKKTAVEKPAPEIKKSPPPEPKKPSKPKIKDDIDEAVKAEILPVLKDMRNQRDLEPSREKIMAKGKKAIPVLIEAVGGDDDWAAMFAYEILLKMTKRNRDDTTKVTQMLNKDMRRDCQKDWEDWWFKNKDSIPD
ncbi:MAG: hypothetical protein AB1599_03090 [Planctomycetota bacterium]